MEFHACLGLATQAKLACLPALRYAGLIMQGVMPAGWHISCIVHCSNQRTTVTVVINGRKRGTTNATTAAAKRQNLLVK
jgi:hypothetical protein